MNEELTGKITLKEENKKLRELLWLNHGCTHLYGDDGEMQCNKCMIDFKRDSIERIEKIFYEKTLGIMWEEIKGERNG